MSNNLKPLIHFLEQQMEDEWSRLLREFSAVSHAELRWQPGPTTHSMGWHVRHAIEWRYALLHVWISGKSPEEELCCLGWENEPIIQAISNNAGWHEPTYSVKELITFLHRVHTVTSHDLHELPPRRFRETITLPWRTNRILEEIAQDARHSALHRGHIRQLKTMYSRRFEARVCAPALRLPSATLGSV